MGIIITHTSLIACGTEKMLSQANYYSFYYDWGPGLATGEHRNNRQLRLPGPPGKEAINRELQGKAVKG